MKYLIYLLLTSVVALLTVLQSRLEPRYTPGMTIEFTFDVVRVSRVCAIKFEILNIEHHG